MAFLAHSGIIHQGVNECFLAVLLCSLGILHRPSVADGLHVKRKELKDVTYRYYKGYVETDILSALGHLKLQKVNAASKGVFMLQRVYEVLSERARLGCSLQRQQRARLIIRMWRYIHIPLAYLFLLVIGFHSVIELWKMLVLHY